MRTTRARSSGRVAQRTAGGGGGGGGGEGGNAIAGCLLILWRARFKKWVQMQRNEDSATGSGTLPAARRPRFRGEAEDNATHTHCRAVLSYNYFVHSRERIEDKTPRQSILTAATTAMPIVFTLIARGSVVLGESSSDANGANFAQVVRKVLLKIQTNTESRLTYLYDGCAPTHALLHYLLVLMLCFNRKECNRRCFVLFSETRSLAFLLPKLFTPGGSSTFSCTTSTFSFA